MKQDSGLMGMFGLIGGITLLLVARRYVPDLANLILLLIGVCGVLLIILVSVVLYFALKKPKKTEEQKASDEINDIIKSGRKNLMGLRRMSMEIKHARARTLSTEICVTIERIFRTLKEKPDQISSLRPFFNYYLPTLEKILVKYKEIESSGVPTEEITQSTITCLEDIKMATEKQYNNLFENDILDLTVEMEVLTQICKRDGLLTDADFESEKMM